MTVYTPIQSFTDLQLCTKVYSVSIQHFCEVDKLDSNRSLNLEGEPEALRGRSHMSTHRKVRDGFQAPRLQQSLPPTSGYASLLLK